MNGLGGFGNRREAPDVGEQDGEIAPLAAEVHALGMLQDVFEDLRRDVTAERGPQQRRLSLFRGELDDRHHDIGEQDRRGGGHRGGDDSSAERGESGGQDDEYRDHGDRAGNALAACAAEGRAKSGRQHDQQRKEQAAVRRAVETAVDQIVERVGVNLHAGSDRRERRRTEVIETRRGVRDENDFSFQ